MRVRLVCVGKPRDAEFLRIHDRYAERIRRLGVDYVTDSVADEGSAGGRFTDEHVREREARRLLERVGDKGSVTALDAGGEMLSSEALARKVESWATPLWTLVVGGPLGLHRTVLERADRAWSLSRLTFPHELVRGIAAEQIYRALTLVRGIPYHK